MCSTGVSTTDLVGRLLTMSKSSHIDYEGGDQTAANCTKLLSQTTHQDEDDAHYARSVSEYPADSVSAIAPALAGTHCSECASAFRIYDLKQKNPSCWHA